jgi:hypothetical protein
MNSIYISNDGDNDSYGYISRCLLSSLDGTLSACSNITGTLTNLRGIRKIAINGTNYLYFSNKSSGAIYRKVINSDASLGASAVVSSPSLSNVEYLAKNIKHRAARLGLIGNTNVYGTVTLNLFLIANNGINSSVVKLAPPTNSGISITPDTVSLDASAPSRPISIIIPESTPAGIYSLSATSNNGIPATTLNLNVLAPQTVTAVFPDTQSGISDGRTSVGLLPTIRITFSRAVDPVSLTNSSVQLKEASTGSQITLSAPAMSFSDRVAKFTLSANLSSGKTYQLSLVPSLIKDNYGNQMGAASPMLISTFRSGLKIFVTQSSHNGDFGGLAGADSFCQNDNNNPNSGNANYIYKAMLVAQAIFNGNQEARYPGTNWVLYSNQNYYKSDIAATFIAQTNSYGKLPNDFSNRIGDSRFVWSGSNPDWGTDEGAFGTNWACTNWSSASWVVAGYVGNSLKSDYNAWAYRDDGSEIDGKSHINKGDTLAAWCNSTLQVYCVQQD